MYICVRVHVYKCSCGCVGVCDGLRVSKCVCMWCKGTVYVSVSVCKGTSVCRVGVYVCECEYVWEYVDKYGEYTNVRVDVNVTKTALPVSSLSTSSSFRLDTQGTTDCAVPQSDSNPRRLCRNKGRKLRRGRRESSTGSDSV